MIFRNDHRVYRFILCQKLHDAPFKFLLLTPTSSFEEEVFCLIKSSFLTSRYNAVSTEYATLVLILIFFKPAAIQHRSV